MTAPLFPAPRRWWTTTGQRAVSHADVQFAVSQAVLRLGSIVPGPPQIEEDPPQPRQAVAFGAPTTALRHLTTSGRVLRALLYLPRGAAAAAAPCPRVPTVLISIGVAGHEAATQAAPRPGSAPPMHAGLSSASQRATDVLAACASNGPAHGPALRVQHATAPAAGPANPRKRSHRRRYANHLDEAHCNARSVAGALGARPFQVERSGWTPRPSEQQSIITARTAFKRLLLQEIRVLKETGASGA